MAASSSLAPAPAGAARVVERPVDGRLTAARSRPLLPPWRRIHPDARAAAGAGRRRSTPERARQAMSSPACTGPHRHARCGGRALVRAAARALRAPGASRQLERGRPRPRPGPAAEPVGRRAGQVPGRDRGHGPPGRHRRRAGRERRRERDRVAARARAGLRAAGVARRGRRRRLAHDRLPLHRRGRVRRARGGPVRGHVAVSRPSSRCSTSTRSPRGPAAARVGDRPRSAAPVLVRDRGAPDPRERRLVAGAPGFLGQLIDLGFRSRSTSRARSSPAACPR